LLKTPKTPKTPLKEFLSAINPIDTDGWRDMRWYARCYEIFKVRLNTRNKITICRDLNKVSVM
jgi:hypothetical protein